MNILILISTLSLFLIAGCGGSSQQASVSQEPQDVVADILDPDDKLIQQEDQQLRLEEEREQQMAQLALEKNIEMDDRMMQQEDVAPMAEAPDVPGEAP